MNPPITELSDICKALIAAENEKCALICEAYSDGRDDTVVAALCADKIRKSSKFAKYLELF